MQENDFIKLSIFMIKTAIILEIDGNSYKKISLSPTAQIILNSRILMALPLMMKIKYGCLLSRLLNTTVLTIAIRQDKKKKEEEEKDWKKKLKPLFFPDDTSMQKNPVSTDKLLELVHEFRIITQHSKLLLCLNTTNT